MRSTMPLATLVLSQLMSPIRGFTPALSRKYLAGCLRSATTGTSNISLFPQELNILYDSKCNVCKLEIDFLRRRDERLHGSGSTKLKFTDIESSDYDDKDAANGYIDYETGMKAMHAVTPDGKVIKGVPVFYLAYKEVGLGWLLSVTKWPVLKWIFDRGYDLFAANRTIVTRGQTVPALVEAYREKQRLLKEQENCITCQEKVESK